jgi:hypothetical protein
MGFAGFLLITLRETTFPAASSPSFKVARASSILRGLLHGLVQLLIDLRRLDFGEQLAGGAYSKTADWAALRCGRLDHRPESASSEAAAKAVLEQLKAHASAH